MYCPQCGLEYRERVTRCTDCGAALTRNPPLAHPEPSVEWRDLESVLETSDASLIPVARSLLEAEGIPCFVRGEQLQEFLGWGRLPIGINLITGPLQLQVPSERSEEARELLRATNIAGFEAAADEAVEE